LPAGQLRCIGKLEHRAPLLMSRAEGEDFYSVSLDLSKELFPIAYKYGVYDVVQQKFIRYEDGNNRVLFDVGKPNRQTILHDGFAVLPNNTWKGAGMAIPVFSLRSEKSFGVGEFADMPLLVDWAKQVGLKMIQLLPINDTTATHSWMDSYPYAAISAFALHPMYLNLEKISSDTTRKRLRKLEKNVCA
jgi:4-alpha-glucanotransferase